MTFKLKCLSIYQRKTMLKCFLLRYCSTGGQQLRRLRGKQERKPTLSGLAAGVHTPAAACLETEPEIADGLSGVRRRNRLVYQFASKYYL